MRNFIWRTIESRLWLWHYDLSFKKNRTFKESTIKIALELIPCCKRQAKVFKLAKNNIYQGELS